MDRKYDLIIVGAGPIGIACALEAQKRGWSYTIIEKGTLVNSLYHYPKGMQFFSSSDNLELDNIPFICKEPKPFRSEALQYYRAVAQSKNLNIKLFERVNTTHKTPDGNFSITTSKGSYRCSNLVIATGFYDYSNKLNIPGEELKHVRHYFDDAHFYANQKVAIVGANNSAVDAALQCYRAGAKVEMIIRGDSIGERVKYWVRPEIINRIADGSITAHYRSHLKEIHPNHLLISKGNETKKLAIDYVLLMIGYRPDYDFLKQAGVTFEKDPMQTPKYNPETLETEIDGLFLAGVVLGGLKTNAWFIDNSRDHGVKICDAIQKRA
jgi:thioredoxin reductase (NADPH)